MKIPLRAIALSVIGLLAGIEAGVWVARFVETLYSPTVTSSEQMESMFTTVMAASCLLFGALFAYAGFKIGQRFAGAKSNHGA